MYIYTKDHKSTPHPPLLNIHMKYPPYLSPSISQLLHIAVLYSPRQGVCNQPTGYFLHAKVTEVTYVAQVSLVLLYWCSCLRPRGSRILYVRWGLLYIAAVNRGARMRWISRRDSGTGMEVCLRLRGYCKGMWCVYVCVCVCAYKCV